MDNLLRNLASVLAEAFWHYKFQHLLYDFKQADGRVVRVEIKELPPEIIDLERVFTMKVSA